MAMVLVPHKKLEEFLVHVFEKYGASTEEASEVASHLVMASLTGHDSHGVLRAPWYMEKIQKNEIVPGAKITVEQETPSSAVVNGNWGFGQPVARVAMRMCIDKAQEQNVACVTVKNANHIGRVGHYTQMAAEHAMVGFGGVNLHGSSHCVAPFGGIDRRLPTNPISVAFPSGRKPDFLLDMTTSVVSEGRLQMYRNKGDNVPDGWIIDSQGNPSNDPNSFYDEPKGALLPLGGIVGHKGYGLSMAIDGLCGGLSGTQCSNPEGKRHGNACWFMAIRIEAFIPIDHFRQNISKLTDHVKSSRPVGKAGKILVPGEPEQRCMRDRTINGIPIDNHTWERLMQKAGEVNVRYEGTVFESSD